MTEIFLFFLILLYIIVFLQYKKNKKYFSRITELQESLENLERISEYFPEFISHGEKITQNLTSELAIKQDQLNRRIDSAQEISKKLGYLEEKVRKNQLDKSTIDNILILINQGFSASEISPRLNLPAGEIDLIIKLRKYLNSPVKEKL